MTVLGHLQRGGTPTAFDRVLATRFGVAAADMAAAGRFGEFVALHGTEMVGVPLAEACVEIRGVPAELIDVADDVLRLGGMTKRPFRLVAVDLDGTLLRSDSSVSQRTRDAIDEARAAGATVVIVTARSPRSVIDLARDAGIRVARSARTGRPSSISDSEKIVRHTALPAAVGHRIALALRAELPDIVFGWELELRFGSEPGYEARREAHWWPRPEGSFPPCDVLDWSMPFTKLLARAEGAEQERAFAIAREVAQGDASVTLTGQAFVEVMAAGVTKGRHSPELAGEAGIDRSDVVAFGDHVTDIEMLEWAGLGVAVANAHASALAAADVITAANDEDGVAVMLERLVLSGQPVDPHPGAGEPRVVSIRLEYQPCRSVEIAIEASSRP